MTIGKVLAGHHQQPRGSPTLEVAPRDSEGNIHQRLTNTWFPFKEREKCNIKAKNKDIQMAPHSQLF